MSASYAGQNPVPSPGDPGEETQGKAFTPDAVPATPFYKFGRVLCRLYTTLYHGLQVRGVEHVPMRGGVIIASNHQSNLDPVLLGVRLRRPLSFLAKSELFENPYFGWLIRNLNAFPVRQGEGDFRYLASPGDEPHSHAFWPFWRGPNGDGPLIPIQLFGVEITLDLDAGQPSLARLQTELSNQEELVWRRLPERPPPRRSRRKRSAEPA